MGKRWALILLTPAFGLLAAGLIGPLLYLFSFSFAIGSDEPGVASGFTLSNYAKLTTDAFYGVIFLKTLMLSLIATIIAAAMGFVLAHFMWTSPARWRGLLTILVLSPLLVSIVATSYGWVVLLGKDGLINGVLQGVGLTDEPIKLIFTDVALIIGLIHVGIPFTTLSTLAVLERIDKFLPQAAATLGASPRRVLWHVIAPLSLPGLAAGATIVLSLSLSAYVTPAVLGGSGPNFITTMIYNNFVTLFDWPFGATIACLLLLLCFAVVLASTWLLTRMASTGIKAT